MKTSELTGAALDWAVAKCEGHEIESLLGGAVWYWLKCSLTGALEVVKVFKPSTNWSQGGPIIEREEISIGKADDPDWWAFKGWKAEEGTPGPTPLIAAMRCFVASRLGDEVDVPAELED